MALPPYSCAPAPAAVPQAAPARGLRSSAPSFAADPDFNAVFYPEPEAEVGEAAPTFSLPGAQRGCAAPGLSWHARQLVHMAASSAAALQPHPRHACSHCGRRGEGGEPGAVPRQVCAALLLPQGLHVSLVGLATGLALGLALLLPLLQLLLVDGERAACQCRLPAVGRLAPTACCSAHTCTHTHTLPTDLCAPLRSSLSRTAPRSLRHSTARCAHGVVGVGAVRLGQWALQPVG